jgi:hypothetical protein
MEDQDKDFDSGKPGWDDHVDENAHADNGPGQKRALPPRERVVWIVENNSALDDGASE